MNLGRPAGRERGARRQEQGRRDRRPIEERSGDVMEGVRTRGDLRDGARRLKEPGASAGRGRRPQEGAWGAAGAAGLPAPGAHDEHPPLTHGGPRLTGRGAQG